MDKLKMRVLATYLTCATDQRCFCASVLIRAGKSVTVLQKRLGHTSAQMTLDVYGHLWPEDDDQTRDAVQVILGSRVSRMCHIEAAGE